MEPEIYPLEKLKLGGITWYIARDFLPRVNEWILGQLVDVLENDKYVLKNGGGRRVSACEGLVMKETMVREGRSVVRHGLRPSASRRAFITGNELIAHGVPTARPLAWATVRCYGLRAKDYLLTEEILSARPLTHYLKTVTGEAERTEIACLLGKLLALFHSRGFSNRDMKDSNILVTETEEIKLWVVDLDGVRMRRIISPRRASRDMWAIVRSFRVYGWNNTAEFEALLRGYNEGSLDRLNMGDLPENGAGVLAREDT